MSQWSFHRFEEDKSHYDAHTCIVTHYGDNTTDWHVIRGETQPVEEKTTSQEGFETLFLLSNIKDTTQDDFLHILTRGWYY